MRTFQLGAWVIAVHLAGLLQAHRVLAADTVWQCSPQQMYDEIVQSKLKEVDRVERIPAPVLRAIGINDPSKLANPGERYNAGCVQDDKFPSAMLVFAAQSPHLWVVVTRHGGFVMGINRSVIENDGECMRVIQTPQNNQYGLSWPSSPKELQKDLRPEWIAPDLGTCQCEGPNSKGISQYDGLRSGNYQLEVTDHGSRATVSVRKGGDFLRAFELGSHQQLALADSHLFVTFYSPDSSGTRVAAFNVQSGRRIWVKPLIGLRDTRVQTPYINAGAMLTPDGNWLIVCGRERDGSYTEILNQTDGIAIGNLPR